MKCSCYVRTMKIFHSWFFSQERLRYWSWETVAGVAAGFSTSFIYVLLVKVLQQIKTSLPRLSSRGALQEASYWVYLWRVYFLVAYFLCVLVCYPIWGKAWSPRDFYCIQKLGYTILWSAIFVNVFLRSAILACSKHMYDSFIMV